MIGEFKFYNVGQGCFYGGAIKSYKQEFVVVYDCGSVSANNPLNNPIQSFREKYNHIDLLVVSHFDQDHVNGIRDLIADIPVTRIVLPYMPLLQRLVLLASQEVVDDNYSSLLENPTNYFLEKSRFNVGAISYIDQASNEEGDVITDFNDDKAILDRDLEEGFELGEFVIEKPVDNEVVRDKIITDEPDLDENNVTFLSSDAILTLGNEFWEFVFYHRRTDDETDVAHFQAAVEEYKAKQGEVPIRDLFTNTHRAKIKELYKKHISSDVNYSSLCMYHGPLFRSRIWCRQIHIQNNQHQHVFSSRGRGGRFAFKNSGTILTGDQFLKRDVDFNPFYNHYRTRFNRIKIYQVPHHGSNANWKMMPNELNNHDIRCYVINHGFIRRKHPNKFVLQNLTSFARKPIILNNEYTILEYSISPN